MAAKIDMGLTPDPEAVLEARHALDGFADLLPPEKLEDVRLVVSELVTNSVRHGGLSGEDRIRLSVKASDKSVRGKVCDPGPGFRMPSKLGPRPDLSGGWGLPIVDKISDRWGVECGSGACVWFEMD